MAVSQARRPLQSTSTSTSSASSLGLSPSPNPVESVRGERMRIVATTNHRILSPKVLTAPLAVLGPGRTTSCLWFPSSLDLIVDHLLHNEISILTHARFVHSSHPSSSAPECPWITLQITPAARTARVTRGPNTAQLIRSLTIRLFHRSLVVASHHPLKDTLSAALFFGSGACFTSKSNSLIHAIQRQTHLANQKRRDLAEQPRCQHRFSM